MLTILVTHGSGVVIDLTYADRLQKIIERKIRLRGAFTSPGLIEDNEREIRKATRGAARCRGSGDLPVTAGSGRDVRLHDAPPGTARPMRPPMALCGNCSTALGV
jgi:hypothetical protein